jgi:hypothetical protein
VVARNRTRIWLAAGLLLLVAGGVAFLLLGDYPVHHFDEVQPGVLYRGGQCDEAVMEILVSRYHVRTLLNLRGQDDAADWYIAEKGFCDRRGLKLININMVDPDRIHENLRAFLEAAIDPANPPSYVHCQAGSVRTGFAVAGYRIAVQGWSLKDALAEAKKFNFDPEVHLNPAYVKVLQELVDGADWRRWTEPAEKAH